MVKGTINGSPFQIPLEPDGKGSHWFKLDETMLKTVNAGDMVSVEIKPTKEWVEPEIPADIDAALSADPQARATWLDTTPMARWDWIRWIRATNNPETRIKRIHVTCSKLRSGKRRPCCFNRNVCTEPVVSDKWVLREVE